MIWNDVNKILPPADEEESYSIDVLLYDGEYISMGYAEFSEGNSLNEVALWHEYSHIMGANAVDGWPTVTHWMFFPPAPLLV